MVWILVLALFPSPLYSIFFIWYLCGLQGSASASWMLFNQPPKLGKTRLHSKHCKCAHTHPCLLASLHLACSFSLLLTRLPIPHPVCAPTNRLLTFLSLPCLSSFSAEPCKPSSSPTLSSEKGRPLMDIIGLGASTVARQGRPVRRKVWKGRPQSQIQPLFLLLGVPCDDGVAQLFYVC